jgi:hypothetical protein
MAPALAASGGGGRGGVGAKAGEKQATIKEPGKTGARGGFGGPQEPGMTSAVLLRSSCSGSSPRQQLPVLPGASSPDCFVPASRKSKLRPSIATGAGLRPPNKPLLPRSQVHVRVARAERWRHRRSPQALLRYAILEMSLDGFANAINRWKEGRRAAKRRRR